MMSLSQNSVSVVKGFGKSGLKSTFSFKSRFFQNFSFERTTSKKRSFAACKAKKCKSFGKTNRVLQEAQSIEILKYGKLMPAGQSPGSRPPW
jgi:hypothetical protein